MNELFKSIRQPFYNSLEILRPWLEFKWSSVGLNCACSNNMCLHWWTRQRLCGVAEVNHLNICAQVKCNHFVLHWISNISKSPSPPRPLPGYICVPGCNAVDQVDFLSLGKVKLRATEVSITTTTLSAWPNGDERGWLFAKEGCIVLWAQWEAEERKYRFTLCVCVCPLRDS